MVKRTATNKKPVRCVETGETWDSIVECAHAIGRSAGGVHNSIRFGDPIDGRHYEKIQ